MKTNQSPENDETMRKVMREWTVDAPLPPRFQEQVWQRIARIETKPEAAARTGLWRWIDSVLPRPQFAFAYLAVLLASGLAAGSWAAQNTNSRLDSNLSLRYVQSIDPYRADAVHR